MNKRRFSGSEHSLLILYTILGTAVGWGVGFIGVWVLQPLPVVLLGIVVNPMNLFGPQVFLLWSQSHELSLIANIFYVIFMYTMFVPVVPLIINYFYYRLLLTKLGGLFLAFFPTLIILTAISILHRL